MKNISLLVIFYSLSLFAAVDNVDDLAIPKEDPKKGMLEVCIIDSKDYVVLQPFSMKNKTTDEVVTRKTAIVVTVDPDQEETKSLEEAIKIMKRRLEIIKKEKKLGLKAPTIEAPENKPLPEGKKALFNDSVNPHMFPPAGKAYENPDCRTGA